MALPRLPRPLRWLPVPALMALVLGAATANAAVIALSADEPLPASRAPVTSRSPEARLPTQPSPAPAPKPCPHPHKCTGATVAH